MAQLLAQGDAHAEELSELSQQVEAWQQKSSEEQHLRMNMEQKVESVQDEFMEHQSTHIIPHPIQKF